MAARKPLTVTVASRVRGAWRVRLATLAPVPARVRRRLARWAVSGVKVEVTANGATVATKSVQWDESPDGSIDLNLVDD